MSPAKPSSDVESDREISPKLIVGTKKYGRRSRPTQNSDELIDETSDSDNEAAVVPSLDKKSSKVQRSVSQSDVHGAKRRRPMHATKLKRCASLPSHKTSRLEIKIRQNKLGQELQEDSMDEDSDSTNKISSLTQNLRDVWNSFKGGSGDKLNFQQLEIVCERVGLHKVAAKLAAAEVFDKLSIKRDAGIRFDEFVNLVHSDSEMFSSVENIRKPPVDVKKKIEDDDSQVYQEVQPALSSEAGSIDMEALVDLWTAANVPDADELIKVLGFSGKEVKLSELCLVLEEEVQRNTGETLASLLRASLSLHRAEITSLRQSYRQLADENRKLFADNKESNRRATILAQEIDERHSNLEDSAKSKIKSIEMRHNEAIKELTMQLTAERDHIGVLNARLESKIKSMEIEDQRLQQDFASLRDENSALEVEQSELHKQITELLEQNIKLNQDIADMEAGGDDGKHDSHNEEMLDLIEKIETLQMENSNLRDKNDELQCDVDNLNGEVSKWKNKSKLPTRENLDDQEANISSAVKRRGDSPSKSKNVEESPRTGKVRRTSNDVEESDASGDWMALNSELASSTPRPPPPYPKRDSDEVEKLKKKILELLEDKVAEYKSKAEAMEATSPEGSNIVELIKIKTDNEKLTKRCKELEENLEQMSREYENCEDYWQTKLNEERMLFDDDQRQSDDKFAELLQKMTELEDQFTAQTEKNNGRLSPIDESHLESQYLDLENEMEELKVHAQSILDEKSKEIEKLQLDISVLHNQSGMKTPPRAASPDSVASSPINYLLNQNTITGPIRDYQNPNYAKKAEMVTETQEPSRVISPIQKPPSTSQQQQQHQLPQPSVDPETSREMLEVSEALSMISARSIGSNSIQSLPEMYEGTVTPNGVMKLKVFADRLKEEIQELNSQRDSLIMELQQLQEAKPILANAYVSQFVECFYRIGANCFVILENYSSEPSAETGAASNEKQASTKCSQTTTTLHGDDHVP